MSRRDGSLDRVSLTPNGELSTDRDDREATRIYYDLSDGWMGLSVSEVKGHREDAEKDDAIDGWKDYYDGSNKRQSPHHADQSAFKMARGTLGHYAVLSTLDDSLAKTHEEEHAEELLKNWDEQRPSVNSDDIPDPSGDPHAYDGEQAWSRCMRDINWAMDEFEALSDEHNITPESTIEVEQYIRHDDPNYGGQYDLLFENHRGEAVLADLKYSSGIRFDHKLQLGAYARACTHDVDKVAVLWLSPDKDDSKLEYEDCWDRTRKGLEHEFLGLCDKARAQTLSQFSLDDVKEAVTEDAPTAD